MINKLRKRFSMVAIFTSFLTLAILMLFVNALNYCNIVDSADDILYVLKGNDGFFPSFIDNSMHEHWANETPFESRYFFVTINKRKTLMTIDMARVQAIDTDQARTYANQVLNMKSTKGFYHNYRYIRYSKHGKTYMIFLDCTKSLDNWRGFVQASILVSLIGLIIFSVLIVIISGRVMKPVAESYNKQKRFITDAGHEIKTPLATIDADLAVLEMDGIQNEWTQDIQAQTKRLARLTNDLIFLSKMQEVRKSENLVDIDMSKLVSEVANSFDSRAKMEEKTFKKSIDDNVHIKGTSQEMEQLVSILMDNAFKYSPVQGEICISLHSKGKKIELVVYNTCESILKENLPHLFDRFYRADESHNSKTGGYGIGLSIVQAIVQSHKGKIQATTNDEKSLKITVEI